MLLFIVASNSATSTFLRSLICFTDDVYAFGEFQGISVVIFFFENDECVIINVLYIYLKLIKHEFIVFYFFDDLSA